MSTNDPIKSLSPVTVDGPTRKLFDHIARLEALTAELTFETLALQEQNAKLLAALEGCMDQHRQVYRQGLAPRSALASVKDIASQAIAEAKGEAS